MQGSGHVAAQEHVLYCFDVLAGHFNGETPPHPSFEDAYCPLFVTWNKVSRRGDVRLRGCIGTLEPRFLQTALKDYALTSALRDRRFAPVLHKEVASLRCTVSLLRAFEKAATWEDWVVGVHGLILDFTDPETGAHRSATFLPEVAAHEGWSQAETLEALVRKAGFSGPVSAVLRAPALAVTRYQSTAATLSYDEYCGMRDTPLLADLPLGNRSVVSVPA